MENLSRWTGAQCGEYPKMMQAFANAGKSMPAEIYEELTKAEFNCAEKEKKKTLTCVKKFRDSKNNIIAYAVASLYDYTTYILLSDQLKDYIRHDYKVNNLTLTSDGRLVDTTAENFGNNSHLYDFKEIDKKRKPGKEIIEQIKEYLVQDFAPRYASDNLLKTDISIDQAYPAYSVTINIIHDKTKIMFEDRPKPGISLTFDYQTGITLNTHLNYYRFPATTDSCNNGANQKQLIDSYINSILGQGEEAFGKPLVTLPLSYDKAIKLLNDSRIVKALDYTLHIYKESKQKIISQLGILFEAFLKDASSLNYHYPHITCKEEVEEDRYVYWEEFTASEICVGGGELEAVIAKTVEATNEHPTSLMLGVYRLCERPRTRSEKKESHYIYTTYLGPEYMYSHILSRKIQVTFESKSDNIPTLKIMYVDVNEGGRPCSNQVVEYNSDFIQEHIIKAKEPSWNAVYDAIIDKYAVPICKKSLFTDSDDLDWIDSED